MASSEVAVAIERAFRDERTAIVATLARQVGGDLTVAEDAVQDAFLAAAADWDRIGIPASPGAWLTVTARRRAIDRLRRQQTALTKQAALAHAEALRELDSHDPEEAVVDHDIVDDRLRLIVTCCHPALALESRIALTLKTVAGLDIDEIARAFLTSPATVYQRLNRAKKKIVRAGIPYEVPAIAELPARLDGVLRVLLLVFNEGHTATSGTDGSRVDLCDEAIRLNRLLVSRVPAHAESGGLLAYLLLTRARAGGRYDADGAMVALADQDRTRWDHDLIDDGLAVLADAIRRDDPGPYQLQAAIAAVHARSPSIDETDWVEIASLYTALERFDPSPVVRINRAVAIAEADGSLAGLQLLDTLDATRFASYTPFHAAYAELYRRAGDVDHARAAYKRAILSTDNDAERAALVGRLAELDAKGT